MGFWDERAALGDNLRLLEPNQGWKNCNDVVDGEGRITAHGSSRSIEIALSSALNASNLVVLTGAGSSYCAKNAKGNRAPDMAALWDAVEAAVTPPVLIKVIETIPNAANLNKNIEKLLTLAKLYVALFRDKTANDIEAFIALAEKAIVERVDFVSEATELGSHRNFVRKIARRSVRKARARIFTTNYDLCFESAAREQQFVVIDGFSHSSPQVYDRAHFAYDVVRRESDSDAPDYIENVFHLYKMHGSIDWRRKGSVIARSRDPSSGVPVLIYPRDSKYQEAFESPYLDMMSAFQASMREPDTVMLISGFGFNDDHISKPIISALEANMTMTLIVCDVAFLSEASLAIDQHVLPVDAEMRVKENPFFNALLNLVKVGDQRVVLLNGRFEDLISAMPDLAAQTDRERHMDRIARFKDMTNEASR